MIPIVLGVFGAKEPGASKWRSLGLATMYVLGLGATYAILGTIFALLGARFSAVLADPRVVVPLVMVYVALALSMFGAFELALPVGMQARINQVGGRGGLGAFFMGTVGAFTAAPCTGPVMGAFLLSVTATRDVFVGASTLFVHALGIGVLYWLLAVFAGSVPKSGRWMEWVKSIGGIGILCAALYLLGNIYPDLTRFGGRSLGWLVAGIALFVVGIALGAIHLSFHEPGHRLRKGMGVAMSVLGVMMAVAFFIAPHQRIQWIKDEAQAFALARQENKTVMIDFWATWCTPCKVLEKNLSSIDVYTELAPRFVFLKMDLSEDSPRTQDISARYRVTSPPSLLFVAADGQLLLRLDDSNADFGSPSSLLRSLAPVLQ